MTRNLSEFESGSMSPRTLARLGQLNKQLEMYRAFRDIHGAAAVLREIQYLTPAA